jgi:hypothetical protein
MAPTQPAGRRVSVHFDVTEVHDFLGVILGQIAGELLEDLALGGLAGGGVGDLDEDVGPRLEAGDLALEVVRAEGDAEWPWKSSELKVTLKCPSASVVASPRKSSETRSLS